MINYSSWEYTYNFERAEIFQNDHNLKNVSIISVYC
jgi:hypothetical protein